MVRAGLVGLGRWGTRLFDSVADDRDKLEIVCAYEPDAATVETFGATRQIRLHRTFEDLLADDAIDAVILATPHSLHVHQICKAADAGKHVFTEKPLTLNDRDARTALAAIERNKRIFSLGHCWRVDPAFAYAEEIWRSGALGTFLHVEGHYSHNRMANWQSGSWRGNPAEGFSAGYTGMGIHFSDMFIHLFGGIDEVQAMRANRVLDYPGGDVSTVQFRFVNGGTGVLTNIVCTPHYSRLHIFGSKGWVEARHDASASTASVRGAVTVANEKAELSTREFPPHDAVRANLLVFAAAVEQQRPGPFTPFEARHNVQVLEAVSAALKEDGQVKLAAA